MAKSKLRVTELDFDHIKSNFKNYLKSQSEFKDYDFEGAGMNVLLDVLAYNTHYQSFYANMVANEMFLDSAVLRDSVVSIAKHLGYTPRSIRAATAIVDVTTKNAGEDPGTLPSGTVFESTLNGIQYYFTSESDVKYNDNGFGQWVAKDVTLHEGQRTLTTFVVNNDDPDQKFILPSNNIDTTTLDVRVQKSITDESGSEDSWVLSTDIGDLSATSKVYFLQETENNRFELYFGDGIVGKNVESDNVIVVFFTSTNGKVANGIGKNDTVSNPSFSMVSQPTWSVVVTSPAVGGDDPETLQSIKFMAPKFYQAQDRAVTIEDYKTLMLSRFSDVESVFVWGGEDNDPPVYGKVFISMKPISGTTFTEGQKLAIQQDLKRSQAIAGILPEIVDPDYVYLTTSIDAYYDPNRTSTSAKSMGSTIIANILNYGDTQLEKFQRNLNYKEFMELVEDTNTAITRSEVSLSIEKRLVPIFNAPNPYIMKFGNELQIFPTGSDDRTINSSYFSYTDTNGKIQSFSFLEDNGEGQILVYYLDANGEKRIIDSTLGTVDYTKGEIVLTNFAPIASQLSSHIKITAHPKNNNIIGERNQILLFDKNDASSVTVNMINEVPYETTIRGTVGSTPQSFTTSVTSVSTSTAIDTTNDGVF